MTFDPNTGQPLNPGAPPIVIQMPPQQDPTANAPLTPEAFRAMIDEERERVRKEEKDKLYPQMEDLRTQVAALTREREEKEAAEAAEQQRLEEEQRQQQQSEMSSLQRVEQLEQEYALRFRQLEEDRDRQAAIIEREREWSRINEYRARRLGEVGDNVMPQFVDYVRGGTEEEVEASLALAVEKTAQIVAEVQESVGGVRRPPAGLPMSGMPPVDMNGAVSDQFRTLTPEDIRAMPDEDYSANRQALLQAASDSVRSRGLYGAP